MWFRALRIFAVCLLFAFWRLCLYLIVTGLLVIARLGFACVGFGVYGDLLFDGLLWFVLCFAVLRVGVCFIWLDWCVVLLFACVCLNELAISV